MICYTAMDNHIPVYPVPFRTLLSLTTWSFVLQPRITWYLERPWASASWVLRLQGTPHLSSTCLGTVFPNVHRGIQCSKWVTELLKSIFSVPHLFFCVPITAITLLIFLVVWTSGSPSVALLSLWEGLGQALPHLCDNSYSEVPGCYCSKT